MNNPIDTFKNIFKIEELKERIIFTILVLIVVRIGAAITIPGVDVQLLAQSAGSDSQSLFGMIDMFTGGAFSNGAIFALGIMPYISASIILQLAGIVVPQVQDLQKQGEDGRRKLTQWTRYGTVFISLLQSWGVTIKLASTQVNGVSVVPDAGFIWTVSSIIILTAGTVFMMYLGEKITENGVGNGISLIITIGIIALLPSATIQFWNLSNGTLFFITLILLGLITASVVYMTLGVRKIPVQYARRQQGRRVMGGQTTYLPLKVNTAGVMPIIFAQAIMFVPSTAAMMFPDNQFMIEFGRIWNDQSPIYAAVYAVIIILFTYFYTAITFNPRDVADNMKKQGGFIPGIRPGKATAEYIDHILTRITFPGSLFLALVAILPVFIGNLNVPYMFASFFGGTSLLIIVGVALDTLQQVESYLTMRNYDGFMKSGKMRGRVGSMGGM